ncbi:MAG: hypothetical protein A3F11_07640 [Gammaproteobacteria bacterium RIFCSPHIGHO2_12_FULL_37_14]|nr:MAG: hypothetical protein A3F11_07640 [Gammaproteobacteria bacterium RIFCSPHIGHO2_12_FULL_37_14]
MPHGLLMFSERPERKLFLNQLPDEILVRIGDYLTEREYKKLSLTCHQFYNFIHQFYFNSTYGKLISLIEYMNEQLSQLMKNISTYKASQHISICNFRRLNRDERVRLFFLTASFLSGARGFINLARHVISLELSMVLSVILYACLMKSCLDGLNSNLSESFIDEDTKRQLAILFSRDSLLSRLDSSVLSHINPTYAEVNQSLDDNLKYFNDAFCAFEKFHRSLIGKNITMLDLNEMNNILSQEILTKIIDKWNTKQVDADYKICYKK